VCAQLGKKSFEKYTPDIEVAYFDDTLAFGLPLVSHHRFPR